MGRTPGMATFRDYDLVTAARGGDFRQEQAQLNKERVREYFAQNFYPRVKECAIALDLSWHQVRRAVEAIRKENKEAQASKQEVQVNFTKLMSLNQK